MTCTPVFCHLWDCAVCVKLEVVPAVFTCTTRTASILSHQNSTAIFIKSPHCIKSLHFTVGTGKVVKCEGEVRIRWRLNIRFWEFQGGDYPKTAYKDFITFSLTDEVSISLLFYSDTQIREVCSPHSLAQFNSRGNTCLTAQQLL